MGAEIVMYANRKTEGKVVIMNHCWQSIWLSQISNERLLIFTIPVSVGNPIMACFVFLLLDHTYSVPD